MSDKRKKRNRYDFLVRNFPTRMQRKLVFLFMTIILAFVILIGRITWINLTKGSKYTRTVLDQQEYDSRVIPYKRGDILDTNGTKLATSERVYNVILDVAVMTSKDDYIEPSIQVLKDCFGLTEDQIRSVMKENPTSRYEVLKKGIDYDTAKAFKKIEEDTDNYPNVKGIWLEDDYKRTYPYNTLASDVIGFAEGNAGTIGIESAYNSILSGTNGREYGYFADNASVERTVKAAKNGNTVVSTIDMTLQSMVEQCIQEFNDAHKGEASADAPGSKNTAVIIMDPNSGAILAEASYPNFDLNNPRDPSSAYTDAQWQAMSEEEQVEAMNGVWRNFCVSDAFEPGSTAKPFTVAAGLETGALSGNESYVCGGYLHVGDYDIYCHLRTGHGTVSVQDAIAYSCNVALMHMAQSIGVENFIKYQHVFGFGEYTGIDLPGEADTSSLLYTTDTMHESELATCSFGQGFNVTMTQMVSAFSSLINGGYYYEPHVVKEIRDENGSVIQTKDPVLLRKTISQETSEQLKPYLKSVMEYGTGTSAAVEGYDIGGKTGTAEKLPRGEEKYILSYIGYAPQDHPEVLVYVVIDEPNVSDQSSSKYVLELSQKIMAQAFPYLNITKMEGYEDTPVQIGTSDTSDEQSSQEYQNYDSAYEDPYNNPDGAYVDENYTPDLSDWAAGDTVQ